MQSGYKDWLEGSGGWAGVVQRWLTKDGTEAEFRGDKSWTGTCPVGGNVMMF